MEMSKQSPLNWDNMIKIGLEDTIFIASTGLLGLMFREVDIMWRSFYVALLVTPK
jgi:hypothetical protein